MTWKPNEKTTPRQIEKELNRQAVMFEEICLKGFQSKAVKFKTFAEEWFEEYAKPNLRDTPRQSGRGYCNGFGRSLFWGLFSFSHFFILANAPNPLK